jgi:hypothetical protein
VAAALDLMVVLVAAVHTLPPQVTALMVAQVIQATLRTMLVELVAAAVQQEELADSLAATILDPVALAAQRVTMLLAVLMLHGCRMAHAWAQQVKLK